MTREETIAVLSVLRAAYPGFYRGYNKQSLEDIVSLWHSMFYAQPANVVLVAVKALIQTRTNDYPPVPGEINEEIQKLTRPEYLSETEAWALVSKALRNGIYGYAEEFEKLPTEVQRAVGMPEQLKEWAVMDTSTVQSVVASNFMRSFRIHQAREREMAMLSPEIKNMLTGIADKLAMPELESEEKI